MGYSLKNDNGEECCMDGLVGFNLDGGASCAMYYDGQYIATPGRQLTTTLQISVNG